MSQNTDIQSYFLEDILEILRSEALAMPSSPTSSRYLRAVDSLAASVVGTHGSCVRVPSDGYAAGLSQDDTPASDSGLSTMASGFSDWLINQWLLGTPFSTVSLYLDIISSLYGSAVKAGRLPKTDLFSKLKTSLKALGHDGWTKGIDDEIFQRALRLTKNAGRLISDDAIAADLVIWSLTHDLTPLTDVALLKRDDLFAENGKQKTETDSAEQTIISRQCTNARRKYIFDLRQSERTPRQLQKHIAKIVNALFRRARLPQATDPFQTVEALWAYAALRAGIPASQLVSCLGHVPLGLPVLKLSVVKIPDSRLQTPDSGLRQPASGDLTAVGKIFLENPPRWYVMSLRPGVRFTQVCRRIQFVSTSDAPLELFYPCEEIARAVGKKIVTRQRPFIHSAVFFRARLTDIGRLFSKIGDLAWCYRQSARPGAPYADISERQFQLFQQTIARFTPDYEVASSGELELKKNDRVQIVGGLFTGHEATIEESRVKGEESRGKGQGTGIASSESGKRKEENADASGVVYRLNIVGDNGIEWRIHVDSRLLSPSAKGEE